MERCTFIDLFAGLGGFHHALSSLGHRCVFACEIDKVLSLIYEKNFGLRPHGNIRTIDISSIPKHDILCAGFPCQPFSKAGDQQGLDCPQSGDLFDYVVRVLRTHKPRYFIIENVPNLVRHRHGGTWRTIKHRLRLAGYSVRDKLLSPHQFGVPQNRERAFIVGRRGGLHGLVWPSPVSCAKLSIASVLDENPAGRVYYRESLFDILRLGKNLLNVFREMSSCRRFLSGPWSLVPPIRMLIDLLREEDSPH